MPENRFDDGTTSAGRNQHNPQVEEPHHDPRHHAARHRAGERELDRERRQRFARYSRGRPDADADAIRARVEEELRKERHRTPELSRQIARLSPVSITPDTTGDHPLLTVAAMCRTGVMQWLVESLLTPRYGPKGKRSGLIATLIFIAFGVSRTRLAATWRVMSSNPLAQWATGYGEAPSSSSAFYSQAGNITAHFSPTLALHANIEMVRQLDAKLARSGKRPRAGEFAAVDGSKVSGYFNQAPCAEGEETLLRQGGRDQGARFQTFTSGKSWFGYRLVQLTCLTLNVPLVWMLVPATFDERQVLRALLKLLFELWPDCPLRFVVGDRFYAHSKDLPLRLERDFGIHPVFALPSQIDQALPYVKTGGVPTCAHGPRKRQHEAFFDAKKRADLGIPRGEAIPGWSPRIRWKCAAGVCGETTTRLKDDARLYTYLAHVGESKDAEMRRALAILRNISESEFKTLKNSGCGGDGFARIATADVFKLEWIVSLAILGITAKRLAYAQGLYDLAERDARDLDLLGEITEVNPASGPSAQLLASLTKERANDWPERVTPRSFTDANQLLRINDTLPLSEYRDVRPGVLHTPSLDL